VTQVANIVFGITLKPDGFGNFSGQVKGASEALKKMGGDAGNAGVQAATGLGRASAGVSSLHEQLSRLQSVAMAYLGGRMALDVLRVADRYQALQARLKLATVSQEEFNAANAGLFAIAQANGVQLAGAIDLYSKLAPALRELGGTQQHALAMSDLVGKSLRLSGSGAAQSAAAMLQFSQALGSGVLRGDEFNSLMENAPRLMRALADGMGLPLGALRQLAEAGKLTATDVSNALLSQSEKLSGEIAKMPLTVSQAWTKLGNSVTVEIGKLDRASGTTATLSGALSALADKVGQVEAALVSAAKIGVALFAASLLSVRAAAIAAAGAAGILMFKHALIGLQALYAVSGAAGVVSTILNIRFGAQAATPSVLTLGGALKALLWPAALLYGVYEFARYASETFLTVQLGIVALAETAQKAAAYISHPFDSRARAAAIAEIKRQNQEIAQALIASHEAAAPPQSPPLQALARGTAPDKSGLDAAKKHASDYAAIIKTLEGNLTSAAAKHAGLNAEQTELAKMQAQPIWDKLTRDQRDYIAALLDGTSALNESVRAEERMNKAREEASSFIDKINAAAQQEVADLEFKNSLIGKSAIETARLTAERRAQLAVDRQIYDLNQQYKNDLPARDAAVADIEAARPGIINHAAAAANATAIADAHEKEAKRAEQAWDRFAENVQRNLGDELYKGLSGGFMDIGDAFKQMLLRMAADAAAAQIMVAGTNLARMLLGGGGGAPGATAPGSAGTSGGGGGFAPGSNFAAKGAWFTGEAAHFFANGGAFSNQTFDRPTPFAFANGGGFNLGVMGEAGPEAVMPLTRDANGKLGVAAQGGGGRSVNLTYAPVIQIDSRSDRAQVERLVSDQVKRGNAELVDTLQRQGML